MMDLILMIVAVIMGSAILLTLYRMLRGPSASDRIVSLDAITNMTTGTIVFIAFLSQRYIYLDVALVYAILSFAGVIATARYLEGGV